MSEVDVNIFADLDVADAEEIGLKPGTYNMMIKSAVVKKTKDDSKTGLNITYVVAEGPSKGMTVLQWHHIPDASTDPEKKAKSLSYLKARFNDFGIPVTRMNEVLQDLVRGEDQALTDLELTVGVAKQKDSDFMRVTKVTEGFTESDDDAGFQF
jgi:hypothetical protein